MKSGALGALEAGAHAVSGEVTLLFGFLLVGMIVSLALEEKLHTKKSLIIGVFAIVCLILGEILGLVHTDAVRILGHEVTLPVYIPGVDWSVIAIILGSSLFVDVTSKTGLFTWIAIRLTKASEGDPVRLLTFYGVMTVAFSAVLNNVTAMIIVGSLTGVSLRRLQRPELLLGFLLVEGLLTNVGGLLTLISSVPNIIVGNAAGITFVRFLLVASPFVIVVTALTLFLGTRIFGIRRLDGEQQRAEARELVAGFDENDGIESPFFFWFGGAMLVAFIVVIAAASIPGWFLNDLGMGFVALTFGVVMLLRYRSTADRFYQAVDWDLLAFFAGLFVVINVMEHAQVLTVIGRGLEQVIALGEVAGPGAVLISSAAFSSVTNNIPLAAMLAKILLGLGTSADSPLWWAVIFGANLGGNLTPIGSASTLVAVTIIHKNRIHLSFIGFVRAALPFALIQLLLATAYVLLFLG